MMLGKSKHILLTLLTLLSTVSFAAVNTQYNATVCGSGTYLFGCQQLTASGTDYTNTLGDSTVHLNLLFAPQKVTSYDATMAPGQTYLFGCQLLTADATETNALQVPGCECDSLVTLHLSVVAPPDTIKVEYNAEILAGEKYLFGCRILDAEGTFADTLAGAGRDSVVILHLSYATPTPDTVKVQYDTEIQVGETYLFGCKQFTFNESGPQTLRDTIPAINGGDSIIIVNLTVAGSGGGSDTVKVQYSAEIFEGETYLFGCRQLKQAGEYKDTLATAGGDSIVTLNLTVNPLPAVKVAYTAEILAGETYLFGCRQLKQAGEYQDTLTSATGGDSITILTLTINCPAAIHADAEAATICAGETYTWIGHEHLGPLSATGTYYDTAHYTTGCDSVWYQLTLTVLSVVAADVETATICAGDTYTWIGHEHLGPLSATATYYDTAYYTAGCDSVWYQLQLTVQSAVAADAETASICAGDSYTWIGHEHLGPLTVADTYYDTAHFTTGCDSVWYQLTLTLRQPSVGDTTATECDLFIWYGDSITTSGDYTHTLVNAVGCDSVLTLHATINESKATTMDTVRKCTKFYWESADTLITTSGTYTHVSTTTTNCDSVVTVVVEIQTPYVTTLSLVSKFGDRLLMINRKEINAMSGWQLDSLDNDHPEYVTWYQIDLAGDTTKVGEGYYYTLDSGDPLPAGYSYFAVVNIPPSGEECGAEGTTITYTIPAPAGEPALMPSLARPGEDIKVINLNPEAETTIRIFAADGTLQNVYTVSGDNVYIMKAGYSQGFYLVEISADNMKTTLRYIVK